MKKTMFDFDSRREVREAFKAGNRARKKESVQDAVESVDNIQAQIDLIKKLTAKEIEIKNGRPYYNDDLDLNSFVGLTSLPTGLIVKGDLSLNCCSGLTSLPPGLTVEGSLDLSDCRRLTSIPADLKVRDDLILINCIKLTSLPAGLTIGWSLELDGCVSLTSLPAGLTVGGNLTLGDCNSLTSLPADLTLKGNYMFRIPDSLIPFIEKLGIEKDVFGFYSAKSWMRKRRYAKKITEAFRAGNRARKKESVQDTAGIIDAVQAQIDLFREQTGKELEIRDGHPYSDIGLRLGGHTGLTSLPDGLKVGGNLELQGCTRLTRLPADLEVNGSLWLEGCIGLTSLPNGLKVSGDLLAGHTGLTGLPDGLKVGGDLYLKGCTGLTSLSTGLKVGGDLTLTNCTRLTSLPFDLVVQGDWIINRGLLAPFFDKLGIPVDEEGDTLASKWREWQEDHGYLKEAFKAGNRARKKESVQDTAGIIDAVQAQIDRFKEQTGKELEIRDGRPYSDRRLDLIGYTGLTSLPDRLKVQGDLYLGGCTGLTGLPAGLKVDGYLSLYSCTELTSLPDDLEIKGNLYLNNCTRLTSLPAGLKIGRDLDLKNCTGLTNLPAGLKVGGNLRLEGCTGLTSLPFDLVIQGDWIIHKGILKSFFRKLRIPVDKNGDTKAQDWFEWRKANGYLTEAFRAGNRARKKEAVQDSQTDNIDTIDSLKDLLDVCDKVVRLYSGREHQFPKGWVFGTDGSGINPPEITESPVNDRQYLRNWLVKYRYDFNGSRIRSDLAKEIPGDENHKFDSDWDIIHSNGRATHLNFDYTVGVMKKKDEDGYRIIFNDGINEACIYMPGYNRSSFGMALMHLFGVTFMKRYIKAAYYQGVNDPLGDENYKEAVQMIIHLFTEDMPMSVWKPEHVISVEIGQEPVYTNNDFTK